MYEFHKNTRKSLAEAYRESLLWMMEDENENSQWSHPYFWSPFYLYGDTAC
ncbi:MAG: CHAT domain-containing protein [bacterium]